MGGLNMQTLSLSVSCALREEKGTSSPTPTRLWRRTWIKAKWPPWLTGECWPLLAASGYYIPLSLVGG